LRYRLNTKPIIIYEINPINSRGNLVMKLTLKEYIMPQIAESAQVHARAQKINAKNTIKNIKLVMDGINAPADPIVPGCIGASHTFCVINRNKTIEIRARPTSHHVVKNVSPEVVLFAAVETAHSSGKFSTSHSGST